MEETTTVAAGAAQESAGPVEQALQEYLRNRLKTDVEPDQDLFGSGLVTSMFAMELVVHLEQAFDIAIVGRDLRLDNFRSVTTMAVLVHRLQGTAE
jgi:methoxymalonate biosynthesis acyl carrier protein